MLFLSLRFLQRTRERHTQSDAIFLKTTFPEFFFLIQYLQRTCKRHTQSDATFLKTTFSELFFLIQYLQSTYDRHTLCDAIILEKKLHTFCFSYFNSYRGHANNTLSMMQFFSEVLFIDLLFSIIQYKSEHAMAILNGMQ